jgi:hypothetical protein
MTAWQALVWSHNSRPDSVGRIANPTYSRTVANPSYCAARYTPVSIAINMSSRIGEHALGDGFRPHVSNAATNKSREYLAQIMTFPSSQKMVEHLGHCPRR